MFPLLTDNVKIVKVKDYQTAATGDVTSASVDLQADGGWDGVCFLGSYNTAAADNLMHAECSSDDAAADSFADIAGSEIDGGSSDEDQVIDIYQPPERYVRCIAQRGTSSVMGDIWAILYRGRNLPFNNVSSGTIQVKRLVQPLEGTK